MSSHAPAFKVLTSAILFGTVGTAIAYAPENAGGSALGIGRLAIGAILLLIFMPVFGLGYNFIFEKQVRIKLFYNNKIVWLLFFVIIIYGILRNIAIYPLTFLSPP